MTIRKSPRDRLVDEVRADKTPDVEWDAMEARIFQRLSVPPPRRTASRAGVWLLCGVGVLASAASIALAFREFGDKHEQVTARVEEPGAGALRDDGNGLRIAGQVVTRGHVPRVGEVVETSGTGASFALADRVTWILEPLGRAFVKSSSNDVLVLALDAGAMEADVTPSAKPESFAIELTHREDTVRVAVHGTHFRVERAGVDVVIDLSEGVIGVGLQKVGALPEHRVNAPAHVTFSLARFQESFHVDDRRERVRLPSSAIPVRPDNPLASAARVAVGPPAASSPKPSHEAPAALASSGASSATASSAPLEETITRNIVACFRQEAVANSTGSVTATVTTTLSLELDALGAVKAARFTPPLSPSIQACATESLYAKPFPGRTGLISLPLTLTR